MGSRHVLRISQEIAKRSRQRNWDVEIGYVHKISLDVPLSLVKGYERVVERLKGIKTESNCIQLRIKIDSVEIVLVILL